MRKGGKRITRRRRTSSESRVEEWALEVEVMPESLDKYVEPIQDSYQMLMQMCDKPYFKVKPTKAFNIWTWRLVAIEYLQNRDAFIEKLLFLFRRKHSEVRYTDLRIELPQQEVEAAQAEVERKLQFIIHYYNWGMFEHPDDSPGSFIHTWMAFAMLQGEDYKVPIDVDKVSRYIKQNILDFFIELKLYKHWWRGKQNDGGCKRLNQVLDYVLDSSRRLAVEDCEADSC